MDVAARAVWFGDYKLVEGDLLSIDGNDGAVYPGRRTVVTERPERELAVIETWRAAAKPNCIGHDPTRVTGQAASP